MLPLQNLSVVVFVVVWVVAGHRAYSAEEKAAAGFGQSQQHWSPEDLWRGIDVEKLPLEVEITKRWEGAVMVIRL